MRRFIGIHCLKDSTRLLLLEGKRYPKILTTHTLNRSCRESYLWPMEIKNFLDAWVQPKTCLGLGFDSSFVSSLQEHYPRRCHLKSVLEGLRLSAQETFQESEGAFYDDFYCSSHQKGRKEFVWLGILKSLLDPILDMLSSLGLLCSLVEPVSQAQPRVDKTLLPPDLPEEFSLAYGVALGAMKA